MKKLILITIALCALFMVQNVQANELSSQEMNNYISLVDLERETFSVDNVLVASTYNDTNAVIELNESANHPLIWDYEVESAI